MTRLSFIVEHVKNNNSFYKKLYKGLRSLELKNLPTISKQDMLSLMESQSIDLGTDEIRGPVFARVTSGTSGSMACFYRSSNEIDNSATRFKQAYSSVLNTSNKDRVAVINNYSLSYTFARHFEACGCLIVLCNPYDLALTVESIIQTRCNVIRTTPPVALKLIESLHLMGYESLEKLMLAGSPLSKPMINKIKEYFPKVKIIQQYGMAETAISMYQCSECFESNKFHTFSRDFKYEFIDPKTGKEINRGGVGELIITKLSLENPLIRYNTGDLFELGKTCSCGKPSYIMRGRSSDILKLRGITVFKEYSDKAFEEVSKYTTGLYQLELNDKLTKGEIKNELTLKVSLDKKYINEYKLINTISRDFQKAFKLTEDYTWEDGVIGGLFENIKVEVIEFKGPKVATFIDKRLS